MMEGFYVLARRRVIKQAAAAVACAGAAASIFFAGRAALKPRAVTTGVTPSPEPYVASSDGGRLVIMKGGELVMETDIDVRTLPSADREVLEQGIVLNDEEALAHLLEDYSS